MNQSQVESLLSQIAIALCSMLAHKGWISGNDTAFVVPVIVAIGVAGWRIWARSTEQQIATVSQMPVVEKITVNDPAVASRLPENVVSK